MRSFVLVTFALGTAFAVGCGDDKKNECKTEDGAAGATLALAEGDGSSSSTKCKKSGAGKDDAGKDGTGKDTAGKDGTGKDTAAETEPPPPAEPMPEIKKITAQASDPKVAADPILVVSGGFASCDANKNPKVLSDAVFSQGLAALGGNSTPWFRSCFGENPLEANKLNYEVSTAPGTIKTGTIEDAVKAFDELLATVDNPFVFAVGHSFGGWTVMRLASQHKAKGTFAVLATLDPISNVLCKPGQLAGAILGFAAATAPGCQEAPKDMDFSRFTAISVKTNHYQVDYAKLKSGEITGWTNTKVATGLTDHTAHVKLQEAGAHTDLFITNVKAELKKLADSVE